MKTIVVATDFSEAALNAAQYAAALTRQIPVSRLILYHSYYDLIATDTPLTDAEYYLQLQEDSMRRLDDLKCLLKEKVADGIAMECIANISSLRDAVCIEFAQKAELIVMGITGKSKWKEKILGSQAIMAARHTAIPLLLIPYDAAFKGMKKAVFAWDMKSSGKLFPEKTFKDILHALKAKLLVFNVDYENKSFGPEIIDEQKYMHQVLAEEDASFFYSSHPDAAEGIIDFAESQEADVVMVIPRKDDFPENLFRKKITRKLALRIKIPLIILPPRQGLTK